MLLKADGYYKVISDIHIRYDLYLFYSFVDIHIKYDIYLFLFFGIHIKNDIFICWYSYYVSGRRGRDRMVVGFTTTYAFSTYKCITTDAVSSNLDQREVYNIMW